jgi:4-amino-4-deoxy-L-arabinose transferase-like glycosyltransferase
MRLVDRLIANPERLRVLRGGLIAAAGATATFLLMADDAQLRVGIAAGALAVAVCAIGLMDLMGSFEDDGPPTSSVDALDLARPVAAALACFVAVTFAFRAGVHGVVPPWVAGCLVVTSFVACVASFFAVGVRLGPYRTDENGEPRALLRRHGFWLWVVMAVLYLPTLGFGSLIDPWETHYGEVAREILARDDWISTWWSWEGFFYSKPILGIWVQSIAMGTLGVHVEPGRMLLEAPGTFAHPEWAVRAPFVLFAMGGTYLLYKGTARWFGRRAGLLGALVLTTSPQWFLLAHQSMTDMPYVASLSAAMGLVLCAARVKDDTERVASWEVRLGRRSVRLTAWHAAVGTVLVLALPQILYLFSRNLELVLHAPGPHGFRPHLDQVFVGSGLGNCHQPGDPICTTERPASAFEPWMQATVWTALLAGVLWLCRSERRKKRVLYLGAWVLAAVATMAKGPAGVAIPMAAVGAWLGMTGRWKEIPRAAMGAGSLVVLLLVGPWFVAMCVRHGSAFIDELIFHDMWNRALDHVHDTNSGFDTSLVYYVEQLGYGLFPWITLVPLGIFSTFGSETRRATCDAAILLFAWFAVAFALFAFMGTKFHHYIAPAVPPLALLVGVALDGAFARRRTSARAAHFAGMMGAAALGGALLALLLTRDLIEGQGRLMQLFTYRYDRPWPASLDWTRPLAIAGGATCFFGVALAVPRVRRLAAYGWVALAAGWAAWVLWVYLPKASPHWGQRSVIEAYYADRTGPEEPIVAYDLNWKGENFYTSNRIPQFGTPTVPPSTPKLPAWTSEQKEKGARVMYFVTEHNRVAGLRKEIAAKSVREVTTREDSNQFVLVRVEL